MTSSPLFKIDFNAIGRLGDKIGKATANYDKILEARTKKATDMVWRIAHQRRPYITKAQMKAEGRSHRVSDPSAQLGVPVAAINGGRLQASVTQSVKRVKGVMFRGIIETVGIPYAGFLEYGTSRMRARPFMRPAIALTKDAIKSLFGMQVTSNT